MENEDFSVYRPNDIEISSLDVEGEQYQQIMKKVSRILNHQKGNHNVDGIKGFIFHGDVGLGKTMLSKVIARRIADRLIFVDGSDIARPKYGESEERVNKIFEVENNSNYKLILVDDCESVFPKREWMKGESWHVAQNNVFFHKLDNIKTPSTGVILTTNRFDLVDKAVKDRLYPIKFPYPNEDTLTAIAEAKATDLDLDKIPQNVRERIKEGEIKTVRELEKMMTEAYINAIR